MHATKPNFLNLRVYKLAEQLSDIVRIARESLNETHHWLRRANKRGLLTTNQIASLKTILDELGPRLNAYLNSIGSTRPKTNINGQLTTNN